MKKFTDPRIPDDSIKKHRKEFNYAIENFRAVSITLVVLSHLNVSALGNYEKLARFILADATTFFIFISGFLFHSLSKNDFSFGSYVAKKAKFVGVPYLFLSTITILVGIFFDHHLRFNLQIINYILYSLWAGGLINGPAWFIPMIWCFFISSPILYFISKKKFLPIITIIALFISLFSVRSFCNANPILNTIHYMGIYMLGICFSKYDNIINYLKGYTFEIVMTSIFICFFIYQFYSSLQYDVEIGFFSGFLNPNFLQIAKLFMLVAIYFLINRSFDKKFTPMSYIANISFGLFFIHGLWLTLATKILMRGNIFNNSYILLFQAIISISGSVVSIEICKKILGKGSRYAIGC